MSLIELAGFEKNLKLSLIVLAGIEKMSFVGLISVLELENGLTQNGQAGKAYLFYRRDLERYAEDKRILTTDELAARETPSQDALKLWASGAKNAKEFGATDFEHEGTEFTEKV